MRERRHLMFASSHQLAVLCRAKSWFIDGTFKLCRQPFSQLLTVNAFVRSGDCVKQVPLVFVIMSRRKKRDYKEVFRALCDVLPVAPVVSKITLDFEKAMWSTLPEIFPTVRLHGCSFHWTQALWRKVSINLSLT